MRQQTYTFKKVLLILLIGFISINSYGQFNTELVLSDSLSYARYFDVGDINGDNDLDVVSASYNGGEVVIFMNNGGLNFAQADTIHVFPNYVFEIIINDLDLDGDLDLLVESAGMNYFENTGTGNFNPPVVIGTGFLSSATVVDLDQDGDKDLVGENANSVAWMENNGGNFTNSILVGSIGDSDIKVKDFDNDGDPDFIVSNYTDTEISWIENLGNLNFGPATLIYSSATFDNSFTELWVDDIDHDNDMDVLVANTSVFNASYWLMNMGDNITFQQNLLPFGAGHPKDIVATDLDDDNDLDILMANRDLNLFGWCENLGNSNFGPGQIISNTSDDAYTVNAFDFDNDGDNDVIGASEFDSTLAIFENLKYSSTQVSGTIFIDVNQNSEYDSLDVGLNQIGVYSTPTSDYTFSYQDGDYFMNFSDTNGIYTISTGSIPNWGLTTDSISYTVVVDSNFTALDSLDFGFYPSASVTALNPELVGAFPRCNDTINYWLSCFNMGSSLPSGIIELVLDDSISYVGSTFIPDSVIGQSIFWSFDSLFYFSDILIALQVKMPDFNSIGEYLNSYINIIELDNMGTIIGTYSDTLTQTLVCAYDPNDKLSTPEGIDDEGFIDPSTGLLEYTIRFQNTGNDTANVVVIKDQLDTNLVWSSVSVLASSHEVQTTVDQNGEITFLFNNILLPDSNVNFLGSQGFVKYSIDLMNSLPAGTEINNSAEIYFDLNPAVITNTALNTIYGCEMPWQNFNVSDTITTCFGNTLSFAGDMDSTYYLWSLDPTPIDSGYAFSWYADSIGLFDVSIEAINPFCDVDTLLWLYVAEVDSTNLGMIQICQGDSVEVFSSFVAIGGIYSDTLNSIYGCDSIIYQQVSVNPTFSSNLGQIEICEGDSSLIFSNYQHLPGIYYDSTNTTLGCDSVGYYELIVHSLPNVNISNWSLDTLCIQDDEVTLGDGTPVGGQFYGTGVSNDLFYPAVADTGLHVISYQYIDINGCQNSDSALVYVENCALLNKLDMLEFSISPNPFKEICVIKSKTALNGEFEIKLIDINGIEIVNFGKIMSNEIIIDGNKLASGSYFLIIENIRFMKIVHL